MSRLGSISGSPPEKLITCMPSATAASIAATIAGELAFGLSPVLVSTKTL